MGRKKSHFPAPIPPGNQPRGGPQTDDRREEDQPAPPQTADEGSFEEQDPKRRQGDFTGAGEHPYVQPGGLNDADH